MSYSIVSSKTYEKQLAKFKKNHPELAGPYEKIISLLKENPFSSELHITTLKGNLEGYYRVWIKRNSRIMYEILIEDKEIILLKVGMREDFY